MTYQDEIRNAMQSFDLLNSRSSALPSPIVKSELEILPKNFTTSEPEDFKEIGLPIGSTRRSSEPDIGIGWAGTKTVLQPEYGRQWYSFMEYLSQFNPHVSKAMENIVTMSHTRHVIYFSDSVPTAMQKKMQAFIDGRKNNYYEFTGGESSLIDDLLIQVSLYGAVSFEMIPKDNLKGIRKVARVSPKGIYFRYLADTDTYETVQQPKNTKINRVSSDGYILLNPNTYKYIALRRVNESPYAMIPFLAAVEGIMLQKDMLSNFKNMMKKVGMLGFLSVLVNKPEKVNTETNEQYYDRILDFLRTQVEPAVKRQIESGTAIGFKGTHEFKLEGTEINSGTAKELIQIVDTIIFEGLKQDPNLHGQNYSTTETFGNVILALMSQQAMNFQKIVAKALEEIYMLDLLLGGFNPGSITVEFDAPTIRDAMKEAQTEGLKITNVDMKQKMGIISQQQAAQELGYDKPFLKERPSETPTPDPNATPDKTAANIKNVHAIVSGFIASNSEVPEYIYDIPEGCGTTHKRIRFNAGADFGSDTKLENLADKYYNAVSKSYETAMKKISQSLQDDVENRSGGTVEDLQAIVYYTWYRNWNSVFISPNKENTKKYTEETYSYYRKNKKVFGSSASSNSMQFDDIPEGLFDLKDFRTIDYLAASDDFYLGKFVVDADTRRRITAWVSNYYLEVGNPLGDKSLVDNFIKEFQDFAQSEEWKIRRITETTLNKARNYANVRYLDQAGIETYEIVEVGDQKTCDWCTHMDGKTFTVKSAVNLIDETISSPVQDVPKITPFATSIKIDEFKKLSEADLEAKGIMMPSFHAFCRGRVVLAD